MPQCSSSTRLVASTIGRVFFIQVLQTKKQPPVVIRRSFLLLFLCPLPSLTCFLCTKTSALCCQSLLCLVRTGSFHICTCTVSFCHIVYITLISLFIQIQDIVNSYFTDKFWNVRYEYHRTFVFI